MHRLLLLLVLSTFTLQASAQSFSLKGVVKNFATKETIPICNVYFSGSSIGTMTDKDGKFTIPNVRPGSYDLVVSHVSYNFRTIPITIDSKDIDLGNILLKEKEIETTTAEVRDKVDRKWRKNFTRFKKYIFGKHYREKDIKIPNAYVAEFLELEGTLVKKEPFALEIENNYTGYKIFYPIQEFLLGQGTEQFMVGFPRFEKMEAIDVHQENEWNQNRADAYNGSLRHFFKSLLADQSEENRFKVKLTNISPIDPESSIENGNSFSLPLEPFSMPEKFTVEDTRDPRIKKISYDGFIELTYFGESSFDGNGQTTFIEATEGHFFVYENGVIIDPTSIIIYGYLATEGLYEMLPFDFVAKN